LGTYTSYFLHNELPYNNSVEVHPQLKAMASVGWCAGSCWFTLATELVGFVAVLKYQAKYQKAPLVVQHSLLLLENEALSKVLHDLYISDIFYIKKNFKN